MRKNLIKYSLFAGLTLLGACSSTGSVKDTLGWGHSSTDVAPTSYGAQSDSGFSSEASSTTTTNHAFIANYEIEPGHDLTVYFAYDNDSVQKHAYDALVAQAEYLRDHPQAHVRLEGNTDERGSSEYNMALGWRRADAVSHFLIEHGADKTQISEVSYGEEHPIAYEHDGHAWQLNRRVDVIYEQQS